MKYRIVFPVFVAVTFAAIIYFTVPVNGTDVKFQNNFPLDSLTNQKDAAMDNVNLSEAEWKKRLTPEQYRVLREKGTERPFTGIYWDNTEKGTYRCAACGNELFSSDTKFDAGCGWPSFYDVKSSSAIELRKDTSFGMLRYEVICKKCGSHLGHVFDDGPAPTNLRYCINSASLHFEKADSSKEKSK